MENRRGFLKASVAAAAVSRSILGANDRIQMAIIGTGERGGQVHGAFTQHKDQVFVAACDVARDTLDDFVTRAGKMSTYTDYRRVLERKDVDAVLIATPDHWHSPILVAACEAGKDAYVEKPISNAVEPAKLMVDAVRKYNRVVQVGLMQRSWKHFQECAKIIQDGYIGQITHLVIPNRGSYLQAPQATSEPPETLDWEMFQGPAPRHPYKPSRLFWRSFYDYGGGNVTDWGVHYMDSANECMRNETQGPLLTSGAGQYCQAEIPERDQIPDSVQVVWQYPKYTASFINVNFFPPAPGQPELQGTILYGTKGVCMLNRSGYEVRPSRNFGLFPSAQPGDRGARGGRPSRNPASPRPPAPPLIEPKSFSAAQQRASNPNAPRVDPTAVHARNFLDCVKSRQQPVCHIGIGFNSSLPCILGVQAIREGRTLAWDDQTRTVKPV
jgi:predicted dehydrogenase